VSDPEPQPGEVFADRFRIEAKLGMGGMGAVYRATQLALDREVALKVLLPRFGADADARSRFEREARVLSELNHPGVVRILDFGEHEGRMFLAMELLDGTTLRPRIAGLEMSRAVDVAFQIADVLVAAHEIPLVHRDLKPENVFVERTADGDARIRVLDFGLAFIAGQDADARLGRMTVEGVVAGTPAYVSPEQARGGEVGPPSDIYSLGCVLYEMLAGAPPFEGESMDVLTRHMFVPPPPLRDRRADRVLPSALEELVLRMLGKRPDERPTARTVRAVLAALDPGDLRKRERARDDVPLVGRAARMITTPPAVAVRRAEIARAVASEDEELLEVAVVGALDVELQLVLAANGLSAFTVSEAQPSAGAAVVLSIGQSAPEVAALVTGRVPIVADADATDVPRVALLLKAGVDEVVVRPLSADDLVRKLWRAIRKARRTR